MRDKSLKKLVGQFCRTSDGERVLVESVVATDSSSPAKALVQYVEGVKKGTRGSYFATNLEPLGSEIPIDENLPSDAS